jgi:23S rRNA (guanosine2251-2'-O)-methyltransferase
MIWRALYRKDAPHQGLVLEVAPLEDVWLTDALAVDE